MGKNITYKSKNIATFYQKKRSCWNDFYDSERWIFERIAGAEKRLGKVLDVGCAAGGLGLALTERFSVESYFGVDISEEAIKAAINNNYKMPSHFESGDILQMPRCMDESFDAVFSLSCADWNIETQAIIESCWKRVKNEGNFIISLRLTNMKSINDIKKSYQYICFDDTGNDSCERANYVVFNINDALNMFYNLHPSPKHILGYGYWGKTSPSARTPCDRLVFTVFALKKDISKEGKDITTELHLPLDLLLKT